MTRPSPENWKESLVYWSTVLTYPLYYSGLLYAWNIAAACALGGGTLISYVSRRENREGLPAGVWLWIACVFGLELTLVAGHQNAELGFGKAVRSSTEFLRSWALFALLPLAGSTMIRSKIIYRAASLLMIQSLLLFPFLFLAYYFKLPSKLYTSPLPDLIGMSAHEYFDVQLYTSQRFISEARWMFYSPWAPAAGLSATLCFFLILEEKNLLLRGLGLAGAILQIVASKSRLAAVAVLFVMGCRLIVSRMDRKLLLLNCGLFLLLLIATQDIVRELTKPLVEYFDSLRPSSSLTRERLHELGMEAWRESPIFGHGIILEGKRKIVSNMPVGSHHTWIGLLVVKGIVGFILFLIPFANTLFSFVGPAMRNRTVMAAGSATIVLALFTFSENLEALSYTMLPVLVLWGIAFRKLSEMKPTNETKPLSSHLSPQVAT